MNDLVYNKSLCDKVEQILAKGKSIARVATDLGVCRETLYVWCEKHPEFDAAMQRGRDACQAYWEDIGEDGVKGNYEKFGGAPWIFTMKNRFRKDYAEDKKDKSVADSIVEKLIDKLVE